MKNIIETVVGFIVVAISISFVVIAYKSGNFDSNLENSYPVMAHFNQIDGIKAGSEVKVSGIKVGQVLSTTLDHETYNAIVEMNIFNNIKLPTDSSAKILSDGLLGDKYITLVPGADTEIIKDGGRIEFTQSSINIEGLISRFIFGSVDRKE